MGLLRGAFLVLVAASAVALFAQTTPNPDPTPVFRTNARDVVVDVVVTKSGDEPVAGLRATDFQVLEDGRPQVIDFFEEHAAKALPPGALKPLPKMPPGVYTNVPPAPEDDAVNVLLLDSLNTPPSMISYARNQILGYLNHVKPGTRMAIFALNGKLNIVQGFTGDAALLRDVAIRQTAPGISPSLVTKSEIADEQELESFLASNLPSPGGAPGSGSPSNGNGASGANWSNPSVPMSATSAVADAFANYQSYKQVNRTRMTLEAMSEIARYLSAVPGRKNLIWFAGDFPVVILPKFDQRMEASDNGVSLSQVRKAADLLTAARVAVYPVYANGLMSDDIVSADNRGPASAAGIGNLSSVAGVGNYTAGGGDRASEIAAMNQIASDTGGKAVYNTNDLDTAIGRSIANGAHYYTMVYSPANKKMDGKYRSIEVKVPQARYKLSFRHGYNADQLPPSDTAQRSNPLQPLMTRGLPASTQILYGVRVVPASPQPPATAPRAGKNAKLTGTVKRYSVDFMIRWSDVKLDAAADGKHTGKIEIELLAYDRIGNTLNWLGGTQAMDLTPDVYAAIQKSGVPAHFEIDVPADKDVFLETGVYDWQTGKAGTMEVALPVEPSRDKVATHDPHGTGANRN